MDVKSEMSIELLKFHWEKWRAEARAFWRHISLATLFLVALLFYQFDAIKWKLPWLDYTIPSPDMNALFTRLLFCPLSWCLLMYILHEFADLMRHRVPDDMEAIIHNNLIEIGPFPKRLHLKRLGRSLYLTIFVLYFGTLSFWLIKATFHVLNVPHPAF